MLKKGQDRTNRPPFAMSAGDFSVPNEDRP